MIFSLQIFIKFYDIRMINIMQNLHFVKYFVLSIFFKSFNSYKLKLLLSSSFEYSCRFAFCLFFIKMVTLHFQIMKFITLIFLLLILISLLFSNKISMNNEKSKANFIFIDILKKCPIRH